MAYSPIKTLAKGTAHATQSIVYTSTVGKSTEVCSIWFHNSSNVTLSSSFWLEDNTQRHFCENIAASVSYEISPKVPFVLSGTGSIYLASQQSSSINYIITGREEQ